MDWLARQPSLRTPRRRVVHRGNNLPWHRSAAPPGNFGQLNPIRRQPQQGFLVRYLIALSVKRRHSSLDSIAVSRRNFCSLSRRAASISLDVGSIPRLFSCVIRASRLSSEGTTILFVVLAQGWDLVAVLGQKRENSIRAHSVRSAPRRGPPTERVATSLMGQQQTCSNVWPGLAGTDEVRVIHEPTKWECSQDGARSFRHARHPQRFHVVLNI
jgi:hypothetical protein